LQALFAIYFKAIAKARRRHGCGFPRRRKARSRPTASRFACDLMSIKVQRLATR
jgi:hypothetical protein